MEPDSELDPILFNAISGSKVKLVNWSLSSYSVHASELLYIPWNQGEVECKGND